MSQSSLLRPVAPPPKINALLGCYLFIFGFILASFPARNPDFWLHCVQGRSLLQHWVSTGSFTPLYDVLMSLGSANESGFVLVGGKAIMIGGIGLVLMQVCSHVTFRVFSLACIGLALMAISTRAGLQPQTMTVVALAVLLWIEFKPSPKRIGSRSLVWLAVLFLCWSNLDRGFLYGLAAFAVLRTGRWLDDRIAWSWKSSLLWPLLLLTGVSLLNPGHMSLSFPTPTEWNTLRTPLNANTIRAVSDSPAALSYYPLVVLCGVSFALNRTGFRWQRALPCLVFGTLSALFDRTIPLFCIIAAPITALNLDEVFVRRQQGQQPFRLALWARRILGIFVITVAALFLILAWPGWLQFPPYEARSWKFDLPTSPAVATPFLNARHHATDGAILHLTPESEAAFRYQNPGLPNQCDATLTRALSNGEDIFRSLQDAKITTIVAYHPTCEVLRLPLNALLRDGERYPLLFLRGGVAIFGVQAAETPTASAMELTTFAPHGLTVDREAVPLLDVAPAPATAVQFLREAFTSPRTNVSLDRDEAELLLLMADVSQAWVPQKNALAWSFEQAAGLAGSLAISANPAMQITETVLRTNRVVATNPDAKLSPNVFRLIEREFEQARASKDQYLFGTTAAAIPAARRAVALNPLDSRAYLHLGDAYMKVMFLSRERAWGRGFKELLELRQAQAATALHRAVELSRTPSPKAHRLLAAMYQEMGYLDLCLEHLQKERAALRPAYRDEESAKALQKHIDELQKLVTPRREQFDRQSEKLRVADQAALAFQLNLAGLALEILLKSDIAAFGLSGLKQELLLLARTGAASKLIEYSSPEQRDAVGFRTYHWFRAQAYAGLGEYTKADAELVQIGGSEADLIPDGDFLAKSLSQSLAKNILAEATVDTGLPNSLRRMLHRTEFVEELQSLDSRLKNLAEVSLLRGTLSLEIADAETARQQGQAALDFLPIRTGGTALPLRAIAQSVLDRSVRMIRDRDARFGQR